MKSIKLKISKSLHEKMLKDLRRSHEHAYERIGFLYTHSKKFKDGSIIIFGINYKAVDDVDYNKDKYAGASINSTAIRKSMQRVLDNKCGCFHVHLHDHKGKPSPSNTDINGGVPEIVESFSNVESDEPHGIIILSTNSSYVTVKINSHKDFIVPELITVIGYPMQFHFQQKIFSVDKEIYKRQSFLGEHSQFLFENVRVGIVGVGGGGSHIAQQLAHIGIKNITIFDNDKMEASNLNRLIGGWFSDISKATLKINIAKRIVKKILPKANLKCINSIWQKEPEVLQQCDLILGGVDTLIGRKELEAECRRYMIPYIDIGMDVYTIENSPYMSGQVILSMPGMPCLSCMNFLTEENITKEAKKYGDVGGLPQVVWPNGILASSAVGILVDLITGWTNQKDRKVYLSYDGNLGLIESNARAEYAGDKCPHYTMEQIGPVKFKKL